MLRADAPICNAARPNRSCPGCDRLERIEHLLLAVLERLPADSSANLPGLGEPLPDPVPPLVRALAEAFGGECFTGADVWHRATVEDAALWDALQLEGLAGSHGIGRRLPAYKGRGLEEAGREHGANRWAVSRWARETPETP